MTDQGRLADGADGSDGEFAGLDVDALKARFDELGAGSFDADDPPDEALAEVAARVTLTDDEVDELFGEELGLSWSDLMRTPGRTWRRASELVRDALCEHGEPKAWLDAASSAGLGAVTTQVIAILALPATGGISILIGIVVAGVAAEGFVAYCRRTSG
jgi:hypothetical protein